MTICSAALGCRYSATDHMHARYCSTRVALLPSVGPGPTLSPTQCHHISRPLV